MKTKADIVDDIFIMQENEQKGSLTKKEIASVVDGMLQAIRHQVAIGNAVQFREYFTISPVLKKAKKDNSTLFIDASKECVKITNNNKLTPENIGHIVQMFADRKDVQYQCKLVGNDIIAEGDYNLSVSTYVEQEDTREKVDIVELNARIEQIVAHENELRKQIDEIIKEL